MLALYSPRTLLHHSAHHSPARATGRGHRPRLRALPDAQLGPVNSALARDWGTSDPLHCRSFEFEKARHD